ncbi:MAG: hypothetical protein HOE85_17060 [Nitrospinaceae bacterium]|nr:hypothetical protein [Nitrospinaceae bacterium]
MELNPRLLGTSQLMTELELHENPGPPTISWHLAELLGAGVQDDETKPELERIGTSSLHGFQLLLRNTRPHRVRIQSAVKPGIYTLPGETPVFIRDGDRIADLEGPEEILVTCSPPESGTVVEPRGAFFKLEGLGRLLDDNGESVTPMTTQMVNSFTVALQLTANVQGDAR